MDPSDNASPKCPMSAGKYANHFAVGYSQHEFILDFGQSYSEIDQAELCSRIVTSPVYAKLFYELLMKSIAEYEAQFDTIKDG
ncbi:hypothetical protein D1AOALGA4SA_12572 [Olavius algarvensis Delta 1 endosymbiont]|nr:hypothetical protein D1AOALGA4SA_12572 [Olavius algarvensis Delta 1 endosymbiont]